ncbi:MAG: transporter [Gammaproteobacteria bacterium]|jgi:hypothetical protein|nr:transporter [Gammaproteobacteria bacterium]
MNKTARLVAFNIALFSLGQAAAQDIEPRRWTPLPAGINLLGAGYVQVEGDVFFNPVLKIEDGTVSGQAAAISYVRSFAVGERLARLDVLLPWANMRWSGLLDGSPATVSRVGLTDPSVRLSMILAGGKPDKLATSHTVVGAAIKISVPMGEYFDDKLLNLGENRFIVRPQIGVLHTRGNWSYELTGSVFLYGDNNDFYGNSTLQQEPLYAAQAHVIRTFDKPGYWVALSAGYGWDGQSTVDGTRADDSRRLSLSALAVGIPVGTKQGLKFAYVRSRTNTSTGGDVDSVSVGWSYRF